MRRLILGILLSFTTVIAVGDEDASELFKTHKQSLYQIKVLDISSDTKSSYGTGFAISADGLIATNYHVISQKALSPDDYKLQYVNNMGDVGSLSIISVDVVNDLAIVKLEGELEHFIELSDNNPNQGDTIYSLGNPRDLGMIVSPGTYNGLKEHSFYPRIHFTGSVNPGMSGGPVLNESGKVVGVNVATGGNALGFLVPLKPLSHLVDSATNDHSPINEMITAQLTDNQSRLYNLILNEDWPSLSLGDAQVPSKFADFLSCWGKSNKSTKDTIYLSTKFNCYLNDNIYIENKFQTGSIEIQFHWMQTDTLSPRHFYNQVRRNFQNARPGNRANANQVNNFKCEQARVEGAQDKNIETVYCVRSYKKFKGLYDVIYNAAHIGHNDRALISHYTLSGVNQNNADLFLRQFTESILWP